LGAIGMPPLKFSPPTWSTNWQCCRIASYLNYKRNLVGHATLAFPNMIHVRASMPSISVWSIIVALDITRGLDTDLHDVARKSFTNNNMSKPARVVLDQTLASPHLHAFHALHIYYGCFWSHCVNMLSDC
jgi:hypothetical protein